MTQIDRPILIVGMPRSGTTWLGKIFDSHPSSLYRHEPDTWQLLSSIPLFSPRRASESDRVVLREFVAGLPAVTADRVCGKRPFFPKNYASLLGVRSYAARSFIHKALTSVGVSGQPPVPPQPRNGSSFRLVWKSIESLGRVGLIVDALPDSKLVRIVRHPAGYVASVLRGESQKRFGHNQAAWDFDLYRMMCETEQAQRHGLSEEYLRSCTPEERLAWRWVVYNEKASEESEGRQNVTSVLYEELCAEPRRIVGDLFEFCELPWNSQTAAFLDASTSDTKSDYYSVFKDPIESAWRWQSQLDQDMTGRIMAVAERSVLASPYRVKSAWNRSA